MMRLIDADAIITRLYEFTEEHTYILDDGDVIIPEFPPWVHIEIANAPTIEAIPIEWINRAEKDKVYQQYDWSEILSIVYRWREEQENE